jgi:nucleoside-triphosphatase THEP1
VDTLARLFRQVDSWQRYLGAAHAFILTGERGAGKSTLCLALAERARQAGISVGGIVSISEGDTLPWQGYRVKNLLTGEERPLARRTDIQEGIRCGSYVFDPEGIRFGQQAIEQAVQAGVHLLVVDEVGLLELNGEGWAPALQQLPTTGVMLWVVRASVVEEIRRRYPPLAGATVMDAATMDAQALWERLYGRSIASTYAI